MEKEILSRYHSKVTLEFLLSEKESVIFERKGILKPDGTIGLSPGKVSNEIIGMLNSDGGILVIGVNDGKLQDLKTLNNTKYHDYLQVVRDFIEPATMVNTEEITIAGSTIILYHIPTERERVFYRKGNENVFYRNGDETVEYNRDEVRILEYNKSIRKFEEEKREDFEVENFRDSALEYYKNKINFEGTHADLLVYRHLARLKEGVYTYNNAAILLFAENPEKYICSSSIRYIRYDGIKLKSGELFNVIKDQDFEGPIPVLIERIKRFLGGVFHDYYYLDLESGKFKKIPEYPEAAWLEGIVNALTHRSYNLQGNVVYINHYDNRIEISNSGPLPGGVTVDNIKNKRFSRNPRIATVLSEMGYVRKLNEGVKRIYQSMKESFLAEPEYIDKENMITLVLRNNVSRDEDTISEKTMKKIESMFSDLNDNQKQILSFLLIHKKGTIKHIEEHTNISEKMIRIYLGKFIDDEIIYKDSEKIRDINAVYKIQK